MVPLVRGRERPFDGRLPSARGLPLEGLSRGFERPYSDLLLSKGLAKVILMPIPVEKMPDEEFPEREGLKKCYTCKVYKELSEFNKNKSKADGLNTICRKCSNARSKRYYKENKVSHREVVGKRNQRVRLENRNRYLEYLRTHPCVDCGNSDIRVLEADHLKDKKANVGTLITTGYSWDTIELELAKCEIVCANCHRIRTYSRNPSYRNGT